jgi:hypothetical protein
MISKRIKDHKIGKRRISEAIMDATKINCNQAYLTATAPLKGGGFTSMIRSSGEHLAQKEKKIQKLRNWMKKATNHETFNPQILKEHEKIKVLKVDISKQELSQINES